MPATFDAPGPGHWELDRSHFPGGTTPISQWLMRESMPAGMGRVFAEQGVPAKRLDAAFVNGYMYTRLVPLIGSDKPPRKLPPAWLLRVRDTCPPGVPQAHADRRHDAGRAPVERHRHPLASRDAAAPEPNATRPSRPSSQPNSTTRSSPTTSAACSPISARPPSSTSGCTVTTSARSPATSTRARRGVWSRPPRWMRSRAPRRRPPDRSTSWPRCGPRSRPRASTLPAWRRSTRCVQCRTASPPSSTSTWPSAATCS